MLKQEANDPDANSSYVIEQGQSYVLVILLAKNPACPIDKVHNEVSRDCFFLGASFLR